MTVDIKDVRALEAAIVSTGNAQDLLTFQGILRSHEELLARATTAEAVIQAQPVPSEHDFLGGIATQIRAMIDKVPSWNGGDAVSLGRSILRSIERRQGGADG